MLRVGILTSESAPGLDGLLRHPLRGQRFDVVTVMTPAPPRHGRETYDALTAAALRAHHVDIVLLLGYLYVLTDPMLTAFPNRILNIHDSDLTLVRPDGVRRYRGLHSTRDAIAAGECSTRSSVHIVTPTVDDGPIIVVSRDYPVPPVVESIGRTAWRQRETMMSDWADLAVVALEIVSCQVAA